MNIELRRDLRASVLPWVVSRVIVIVSLGIVHLFREQFVRHSLHHQLVGLFGWDAAFYRTIAQHGYATVIGNDGLRFFPLYPLVARVFGGSDLALIALANSAALVAFMLAHRVSREWLDERCARRAVWILALSPGALASVMGYAETVFLVAAIWCCYALHRGWIPIAIVAGAAAALTRPVGIFLVVVCAGYFVTERNARYAVAMLGPIAGLGAFLWWAKDRSGSWLTPLRLQSHSNLRGATVDPLRAVWSSIHYVVVDHRFGPGLHLAWAVIAVALCVVAWKRLPLGVAAFATTCVIVSLTTRNLDSFERYLFASFPLAISAGTIKAPKWLDRAAILGAITALSAYSMLAFATTYVP